LIYRRCGLLCLVAFIVALVIVPVVGVVIISHAEGWPALGRFFTALSAGGLIGLLAALAAMLVAGGYATMRRVTV
jgi:hypothetical protein